MVDRTFFDLSDHSFFCFFDLKIKKKTNTLLDFGTKKVIWVFTSTQQVLVAEKDKDWLWINWNKPVQVKKEHSFCIGKYLEEKGVKLEED